jgi:glucose/arabinose dehydrogenase
MPGSLSRFGGRIESGSLIGPACGLFHKFNVETQTMLRLLFLSFGCCLALVQTSRAADPAPTEADYYPIVSLEIPDGVVLEAGSSELLPDGRLAVSSRRGEIYLVDNPQSDDPKKIKFQRFAHGLHEVLGLAYRDGWLYATQRGELTRLKDTDGDGKADLFETVSDGWELDGDYHEYAFGSKFDRDGNLWVVLCLTGSFDSNSKYRGWCLRITPDGKLIPTCSGIRSPGGIGMNCAGDMFYTDNQGPWNGACSLKHLKPGTFAGHPAGNRWFEPEHLGPAPVEPKSGSRMMVEAKRIAELEPPACYFPYPKMGQSAAGIACDNTGGKFGPFENQLFVGDQSHSTVMRVDLEKVQGHYQGACFRFREGFQCGCLSLLMTPGGSLFVGGTSRGWGARGTKPYSLERVVWSGKQPFEVHQMRLKPDGFELKFTEPVDPQTAGDPKSYSLSTYTWIYQATYGSPEVDATRPTIDRVEVGGDRTSVRLYVSQLEEGHCHELHLDGVRSTAGRPLLHNEAFYTLNYFAK